MGIQDRDYYREWWAKRNGFKEKAAFRLPERSNGPPPLWGADWHWTLKLLVWLCIAVLVLAAVRLLR